MNADKALKVMNWSVLAVVAGALLVGLFGLVGCASTWQAFKSSAAPAGGAAGGAAVGSLAGPGGAIVGAGVGAVIGNGLEESASLRSGETIGEGALDNELERWKGKARQSAAAASAAETATDWLYTILKWGAAAGAGWFVFRNRANFRDLGIYNGLIHSILGGGHGKAIRN